MEEYWCGESTSQSERSAVLAGFGSGQAGNCCGMVGYVAVVDGTPAEVPDAFSEVRRSEVATEVVGGRGVSKGVVSLGRTPLSGIPVPPNLA